MSATLHDMQEVDDYLEGIFKRSIYTLAVLTAEGEPLLVFASSPDGDTWYQGVPQNNDEHGDSQDSNNASVEELGEHQWPLTVIHPNPIQGATA